MRQIHLKNAIFELMRQHVPLKQGHINRLSEVCYSVQLAGNIYQSHLARRLPRDTKQGSRIKFLNDFWTSPLFSQHQIYRPLLANILPTYKPENIHLIIDRTNLVPHQIDLLMISLSYHKRALPIAWQFGDFGSTSASEQISLMEQVLPLIPVKKRVILHGDGEFGSVDVMDFIIHHTPWDFILGQRTKVCFHHGDWQWKRVSDVHVTPTQPVYHSNVFWTKKECFGPINFFAFHNPYQSGPTEPRKEVRYLTTSLRLTPKIRRVGRRRWGIEPMFRDFKSSGWHIDLSGIGDPDRLENLMVVLSICYLYNSALGRWLSKSGRRAEVDCKKSDITVCFAWAGIG